MMEIWSHLILLTLFPHSKGCGQVTALTGRLPFFNTFWIDTAVFLPLTPPCHSYVALRALQGRLMHRGSSGFETLLELAFNLRANACPLPTFITTSTNGLRPSEPFAQASFVIPLQVPPQLLRPLMHGIGQSAGCSSGTYHAVVANEYTYHYPNSCSFFRAIATQGSRITKSV